MLRRCILALLLAAGCGDDGPSGGNDAAMTDGGPGAADAAANVDGSAALAWVDFAITGCEIPIQPGDAGYDAPCSGTTPLELSFTAISPATIEVYRWQFGDTNESTAPTPTHIYTGPGSYDVSLAVGGPGGTASKTKLGVVVVRAASLGSPCASDGQCGDSLACICDDATDCGSVLPAGLCTADCDDVTACTVGVCADLDPTGAGGADWRRGACLVSCTDNDDCPAGLACQDLLAADGSGGWVRGCFAPGALADLGASCRDGVGALDHSRCASGQCSDLGARGVCSWGCTGDDCPGPTACATFTDVGVGSLCVDRCAPGDCAGDPWLACEAPGGGGDLGFTVDEAASANGYCAPKTCTDVDQCGPDGTCTDNFCAAL